MCLAAAEDHATLAGHHVFGDIEAVAAEIAKRAGVLAVKICFYGVRAVLDHDEIVLACDGHDAAHRAATNGEMYGQDGPLSRGDRRLNRIGIDVLGKRIDIRQPRMNDRVDCGAERQQCGDHLTARLDAGGHHADVRRRRAGIYRDHLRRLHAAQAAT